MFCQTSEGWSCRSEKLRHREAESAARTDRPAIGSRLRTKMPRRAASVTSGPAAA